VIQREQERSTDLNLWKEKAGSVKKEREKERERGEEEKERHAKKTGEKRAKIRQTE
jgi:hypothetical protein